MRLTLANVVTSCVSFIQSNISNIVFYDVGLSRVICGPEGLIQYDYRHIYLYIYHFY